MRQDKEKAIKLREQGISYNEISRRLSVPKSTLSGWFKKLRSSEHTRQKNINRAKLIWAKNIIAYNKQRSVDSRKRWEQIQKDSIRDIGRLSRRELLLVGAALYWAEGYKKSNWNLVFCNSDPAMIVLIMEFFLKTCEVPPEKIKGQVQIHRNISPEQATAYWSRISGIPNKQFTKPLHQIAKSSKSIRGNTLPYGTFRIKINNVVVLNKIKGWITGLGDNK